MVIARDPAPLQETYGLAGVLGPYAGRLSNNGEELTLRHPTGAKVLSFAYSDKTPWPLAADGMGHSLTRIKLGGDPTEAATWAPSTWMDGTPGEPDQVEPEMIDPTVTVLVDIGHPGHYFKGRREPSPAADGTPTTAWTQPAFNASPDVTDWLAGPSGYGYSNNSAELQSIGTVLDDMPGQYQSVYARLSFSLTDDEIATFTGLQATVFYDDGFVL
ncbi:hypothetical protein ACFL6U_23580 [Planctomycetota bacterium]